MTVYFQFDASAVDGLIQSIEDDMSGVLRPAAQAAAQVYYNGLLSEYDSLVKNKTMNLRNALYQAWREKESNKTLQMYSVSWAGNSKKSAKASQHAHLIEYGHLMPYQLVKNKKGEWVTAVKPGAKRPSNKDSRQWTQAERDAYFVKRKGGAKQVAPRPFMRNTIASSSNQAKALEAMTAEIEKRFGGGSI